MPEEACSYVRKLGLTLRQIVTGKKVFFGVLPDLRAVKCLGEIVNFGMFA